MYIYISTNLLLILCIRPPQVEVKPKATRKALAAIAPREAKKGQEKIAKVCANHAEHVKTLERVWAEKQSAVLTAWFNAKVQAALEGSSDDEASTDTSRRLPALHATQDNAFSASWYRPAPQPAHSRFDD